MIVIKEADHRKFPRRRYSARVHIRDHIQGRATTGSAVDINPMGIYLECRRRFSAGEVVSLRFPSPDGDYFLMVKGQVVRVDPSGPGRRGGVAIEFYDQDDWIFDELCSYVYDTGTQRPVLVSLDAPEQSP